MALSLSCGYFVYDQRDMLQYRLYNDWFPSIPVHHLMLLIYFTLALYRNVAINYLILPLLCEVHPEIFHPKWTKPTFPHEEKEAGSYRSLHPKGDKGSEQTEKGKSRKRKRSRKSKSVAVGSSI